MTIFLTTHYMEEADSLCDRVAIMHLGKIMAIGRRFRRHAGDCYRPGNHWCKALPASSGVEEVRGKVKEGRNV